MSVDFMLFLVLPGRVELLFACRVVSVWNSLPNTVGFTSLAVFKRCIRTVDFSEFLMCNDVEFSYLEKVKSESESE